MNVTLCKEAVRTTTALKSLPASMIVSNDVTMTVTPSKKSENDTDQETRLPEPVEVAIQKTPVTATATKSASVSVIQLEDDGNDGYNDVKFNYSITITNNFIEELTFDVKDELPDGIILAEGGDTFETSVDVPAKGKKTITIPVKVDTTKIKSLLSESEDGKSIKVTNTAEVTPEGEEPLDPPPFTDVTIKKPTDIKPAVVSKNAVKLTKNGGVYDFYDGTPIYDDDIVYYMVTLYNPNDTLYTYHLSDPKGSGYYGSSNFYYTSVPEDITNTRGRLSSLFPSNANGNQIQGPFGYYPPVTDSSGNITAIPLTMSQISGLTMSPNNPVYTKAEYEIIGAENDGESVNITNVEVDAKTVKVIFLPFQIKSAIYDESGLKSESGSKVKKIPENTIFVNNTNPDAPDSTYNPTEKQSETIPVGKPDVTAIKALLDSNLNNVDSSNEKTATYGNEDYIYYRINLTNNTTNASGSKISGPYEFLEVLPEYVKFDGGYSHSGSGPSSVYGNSSFFANSLKDPLLTVASVSNIKSNQIASTFIAGNGDSAVLEANYQAGSANAKIYTYRTTVDGIEHDAVYVKLDGFPNSGSVPVNLYLRCKADTTNLLQREESGEKQVTNLLYDGSKSDPIDENTQTIVKVEDFGKYIINPAYKDEIVAELKSEDGLTYKTLDNWKNNGYLLESINVVPGQEIEYLLTCSLNSSKNIANVQDILPALPDVSSWKCVDADATLKGGQYQDETSNLVKTNPITSYSGNIMPIGNGFNAIAYANTRGTLENDLALQIFKIKLPNDIGKKPFENNVTYYPSGSNPQFEKSVTHMPIGFSKTVDDESLDFNMKDSTSFKLSIDNFKDLTGCHSVSVTDDLTSIRKYLDITAISPKPFTVKDKNGTTIPYYAVITTEDGKTYTVTYEELESGFGVDVGTITGIKWNFWKADTNPIETLVSSASGKAEITVQLKDYTKNQNLYKTLFNAGNEIKNTATLTYSANDNTPDVTAEASLKINPLPTFEKAMKIGETLIKEDSTEEIHIGDTIHFEINYTNNSESSISLADLKIDDTLGKAFNQNQDVTVKASTGTLANSNVTFTNGKAEITFTKGTLGAGGTLKISYDVVVIDDAENGVSNKAEIKTKTAETPQKTAVAKNKVDALLQKGIVSIGSETDDLRTYPIVKDGKPVEIIYNAVVFNSNTSLSALPVSYLLDELPEDFSFVEMVTKDYDKSPEDWQTTNEKASAYQKEYHITAETLEDTNRVQFKVAGADGKAVRLAPGEYLIFSYKCSIDIAARYNAYLKFNFEKDSVNTLWLEIDNLTDLNLTSTETRFHNPYENCNDGDCKKVKETPTLTKLNTIYGSQANWLESDVTVTATGFIGAEVSKDNTRYKTTNSPKNFDIQNGEKVLYADSKASVKWEITIDNSHSDTEIRNYSQST